MKKLIAATMAGAALLAGGCGTIDLQNTLSQFSQGLGAISSAITEIKTEAGSIGGKPGMIPQQATDIMQDGTPAALPEHNVRKDYSMSESLPQHSSSGLSASSTSASDSPMSYGEVVETDIEHQTAITIGTAKTQEEARKIALKTAVEEIVGFYMDAAVSMVNDDVQQKVNTVSNGSVTNCTVLSQGPTDNGLYQMKIKAVVRQEEVQAAFKNVTGFSPTSKATSLRDRQAEILSSQIKNADQGKMLADFLAGMDPIHQWTKVVDVRFEEATHVPVGYMGEMGKLRLANENYSIIAVTYTIACDQGEYFGNFEGHFAKILEKVASGKPKTEMLDHTAIDKPAYFLTTPEHPVTARVDGEDEDVAVQTLVLFPKRIGLSDIPHSGDEWSIDFETDSYGRGRYVKPSGEKFRSEISLVTKCNEDFSVFQVKTFPVSEKVFKSYREWYRKTMSDTYDFNVFLQDEKGNDVMAVGDKIPGTWLFRDGSSYVGSTPMLKNFLFGPVFEVSSQLSGTEFRDQKCDLIYSTVLTRTIYFKVPHGELGRVSRVTVEMP